jgi:hypothetical protein
VRRRPVPDRPAPYGKKDDETWIRTSGTVVRLLPDDPDEALHQRFVLRIPDGQTLLIAHNLELSERVPLGLGDRVTVRGVYEWNPLGGLVHWTHADPLGLEDGGYIEYRRRAYC